MDQVPRSRIADRLHSLGLAGGSPELRIAGRATSTTALVTAAAIVCGLIGMTVARTAPGSMGVGNVAATALIAVGVAGALATAVLVRRGLRAFGVAHLCYLIVVVSLPMTGTALITQNLSSNAAWLLGASLVIPAAVGLYATHVEPFRLRVDRFDVPIPGRRHDGHPIRVGVLSDLQTSKVGPYEHRAVEALVAEDPEMILVPGDIFQGSDAAFATNEAALRTLLAKLTASCGVYVVRGDTDPADRVDRAFAGTDACILDDAWTDVEVKGRLVRIGGNRLEYNTPHAKALRRSLEHVPPSTTPSSGGDDGTVRILLAHRPDVVLDLAPNSRVDLTVAGHTHGGQIVVPGFGPLVTLTRVSRRVANGGLHKIAGNQIYVSSGVGLERNQAPQVRLFCRPSVGILTLRPTSGIAGRG